MEYQLAMYDVLKRPKWPVQHKGLYLGNNLVFHCTPENGEHISSLDEFSQGEVVTVIKRGVEGAYEIQQRLMGRLQSMETYKYLSNNCEHAVSRMVSGNPDSPQLRVIAGATVSLLLLWAITRRK